MVRRRGAVRSEEQFAKQIFQASQEALFKAQEGRRFTVFLCGPSIKSRKNKGGQVRRQLKKKLTEAGISVFLGEDDGLEELRNLFHLNAQDNELAFIAEYCDAVIVVASSVGAWCELGLFSWHFTHKDGLLRKPGERDFILVIEKKYRDTKKRKSYLNQGPGLAIQTFGMVDYVDFSKVDIEKIVQRILSRRAAFTVDRRGRPRKIRRFAGTDVPVARVNRSAP
jgi:hypothetical protein